MTWTQKHRLTAIGIFMLLMFVLPTDVVYWRWLMFAMTVVFWLLVSALIAAPLLSLYTEWNERND